MDDTAPGDTHARIRQVALELFTEQGYEKTALREIAERLGVTKAALYYHFKSKEEIVESFVQEAVADIDELIDWFSTQPRTLAARQDFLRRYAATLGSGRHQALTRFFLNNQAVMQHMKAGMLMRTRFIGLLRLMIDPDAPLADQLRTALAVWALNSGTFILRDAGASLEEIQAAALEVSLEMLERAAAGSPQPAG